MNARVLLPCVSLCAGFVVFELACQGLSPYPPLYDQVFEAGIATPVSTAGTGSTDASEPESGSASEDAFDEDTGITPPTAMCPSPSTVFATADNPQTITLDTMNA